MRLLGITALSGNIVTEITDCFSLPEWYRGYLFYEPSRRVGTCTCTM